ERHGFSSTANNQGSAETGAWTQEKHAPTLIASQRLHGGIIDHPHRTPEGLAKVDSHPSTTEILRFGDGTSVQHRPRVPDGHGFVLPVLREALDSLNHARRSHGRP